MPGDVAGPQKPNACGVKGITSARRKGFVPQRMSGIGAQGLPKSSGHIGGSPMEDKNCNY